MAAAATAAPRPAGAAAGGPPSRLKQGRHFVMTLNNPLIPEIMQLKKIGRDGTCRYICWTLENSGRQPLASRLAGKSWTPHLQAYVEFANTVRPGWLKRNVSSRAHFENRHGSRQQAKDYCNPDAATYVAAKGGAGFCGMKCPFIEFGTWHEDSTGKRTDMDKIKKCIDDGGSEMDCFETHFGTMCRYGKGIGKYSLLKRTGIEVPEKTVIWIWGPTGCGKSELAAKLASAYKGTFWKQTGTKWFDGLDAEEAVVFDDFRPSKALPFNFLLRLTDRNPMQVETKGATAPWNPKCIIFTCPEPPREMFDEESDGDIGQLERRITAVKHLTVHAHRVRNVAAAAARKQSALRRIDAALQELAAPPAAAPARTPSPGPRLPPTVLRRGLLYSSSDEESDRGGRQPDEEIAEAIDSSDEELDSDGAEELGSDGEWP